MEKVVISTSQAKYLAKEFRQCNLKDEDEELFLVQLRTAKDELELEKEQLKMLKSLWSRSVHQNPLVQFTILDKTIELKEKERNPPSDALKKLRKDLLRKRAEKEYNRMTNNVCKKERETMKGNTELKTISQQSNLVYHFIACLFVSAICGYYIGRLMFNDEFAAYLTAIVCGIAMLMLELCLFTMKTWGSNIV
eukprot:TRINITY_DN782290_c0_g1_i1.p1 TRINITY_DN782290_c0_g1~~TRINITY_DN782290_c0_g1_i1.p1  ORF type:complete len:194 (+),score=31.82 TRINITY_DN782290_c0_g1_i1:72-653(+)